MTRQRLACLVVTLAAANQVAVASPDMLADAVKYGATDCSFCHLTPQGGDIVVDGKPVKAVAQVSKVGFVYVFDRVSGEPVWPIEDQPVAASTLEGELAAATQPFPTWPPTFEMQGVGEDDLLDFTPKLRQRALAAVEDRRLGGLFLPASTVWESAVDSEPGRLTAFRLP